MFPKLEIDYLLKHRFFSKPKQKIQKEPKHELEKKEVFIKDHMRHNSAKIIEIIEKSKKDSKKFYSAAVTPRGNSRSSQTDQRKPILKFFDEPRPNQNNFSYISQRDLSLESKDISHDIKNIIKLKDTVIAINLEKKVVKKYQESSEGPPAYLSFLRFAKKKAKKSIDPNNDMVLSGMPKETYKTTKMTSEEENTFSPKVETQNTYKYKIDLTIVPPQKVAEPKKKMVLVRKSKSVLHKNQKSATAIKHEIKSKLVENKLLPPIEKRYSPIIKKKVANRKARLSLPNLRNFLGSPGKISPFVEENEKMSSDSSRDSFIRYADKP